MEREDHLFEELCAKGKAYRKRRMAAGEKHGAYLSGRAVKVCKGQMSGKKKKKTNEEHLNETEGQVLQVTSERGAVVLITDPIDIKAFLAGEEVYGEDQDGGSVEVSLDNAQDYQMTEGVNEEIESEDDTEFTVSLKHLLKKHVTKGGEIEEIDALHENEEYCPKCAAKIKEIIKEEVKKVPKEAKTKPAKGKRFAKKVKNPKTGRTRTVSYGQAGKAKKGGDRIRPGTAKGNAYCARSAKIKKCKNPPCANTLSRKKWKCQGSRSVK